MQIQNGHGCYVNGVVGVVWIVDSTLNNPFLTNSLKVSLKLSTVNWLIIKDLFPKEFVYNRNPFVSNIFIFSSTSNVFYFYFSGNRQWQRACTKGRWESRWWINGNISTVHKKNANQKQHSYTSTKAHRIAKPIEKKNEQ